MYEIYEGCSGEPRSGIVLGEAVRLGVEAPTVPIILHRPQSTAAESCTQPCDHEFASTDERNSVMSLHNDVTLERLTMVSKNSPEIHQATW